MKARGISQRLKRPCHSMRDARTRRLRFDVFAEQLDRARIGRHEAGNHVEQGRLAGPGRANEAVHHAAFDLQSDAVHRAYSVVALLNLGKREGRSSSSSASRSRRCRQPHSSIGYSRPASRRRRKRTHQSHQAARECQHYRNDKDREDDFLISADRPQQLGRELQERPTDESPQRLLIPPTIG